MADHPRSPTPDLYSILGISRNSSIKEIRKAYKFLVAKWHPDKNHANKTEAAAKFSAINEAYNEAKRLHEEPLTISDPVLVEGPGYDHTKSINHLKSINNQRKNSVDDSFFSRSSSFSLRSLSRRSKTPNPRRPSMSRSTSKRSTTPTLSRNLSQKSPLGTETSPPSSRHTSTKSTASETSTSPLNPSLSRNISKRSTTPIFFSQSTARRKPPPVERKLACTLEELLEGSVRKIKVTRDVITDTGMIVPEEEILKINVQPGWKKGTKIMFEGKGDEKPGYLPADIVFLIDEKRHPLFERDGDDLKIVLEIPLVNALTGCSFSVPLLGGEKMTLSLDDVIYHEYEKVIKGQGMPNPKEQGKRGDLKIKFLIHFPEELTHEQRAEAVSILQDCF
ncbi:uncharacterized protein LOC107427831 [Ziziphus jujuba]|uniref:Uncharacterized protein LOC107427831 n=2 Tax=Ziziphus jujuba TaxID=326968 RepID=A0ABM3I039_ZIZJJ|nr:uncharacterized protein LOC107427831 [Ziziphus jujuba]KAH7518826.1 hypothetical protein FEM48_Zijuj09G0212400 [Ziziphus jujuba var. spinosa]